MTSRGRLEEFAERLAHRPTTEWVELLLEFQAEIMQEARARFFITYPWWFMRGLLAMDTDNVETLLDLARMGRRDDFIFYAGSVGVPPDDCPKLWEGMRRRLGLAEIP